jgi:hypothetical protein
MICEREKVVCDKGMCVFHTCSRYALASKPEETGPPLHVERSSSGHWLWVHAAILQKK